MALNSIIVYAQPERFYHNLRQAGADCLRDRGRGAIKLPCPHITAHVFMAAVLQNIEKSSRHEIETPANRHPSWHPSWGAGAISCRWLRSLDIRSWRTTGARGQGQDHGRPDTGIVHEMASLNTHYPAGGGRGGTPAIKADNNRQATVGQRENGY